MNHVIRRMLFLCLAAAALAGCGASERDALAVGEYSISEEGMTDLVLSVNGGVPDPDVVVSQLSAEQYRGVGSSWLQIFAARQYLESTGVTISQEERDAIKVRVEDAIAAGDFGPVSRQSEAFEALTISAWLPQVDDVLATPEASDAIVELLRNATVSSRIGELDPDTRLITARG